MRPVSGGMMRLGAVVVTVTVEVCAVMPSAAVTEVGAGVHMERAGAPLHVIPTD